MGSEPQVTLCITWHHITYIVYTLPSSFLSLYISLRKCIYLVSHILLVTNLVPPSMLIVSRKYSLYISLRNMLIASRSPVNNGDHNKDKDYVMEDDKSAKLDSDEEFNLSDIHHERMKGKGNTEQNPPIIQPSVKWLQQVLDQICSIQMSFCHIQFII